MLPMQTIIFIISACLTMGYTHKGGYASSRWFTKTVNDFGKPPEPPQLRHGPEPITVIPTQRPKMPKAELRHYTPVVDYYDPHPADKRSFPFETGMQNLFIFTDPVAGEPFHVSYEQQPPIKSQTFDHGPYTSQGNQPFDGKSGVYPATYRRNGRQPFKSPHSNSYMHDETFFTDLGVNRGYNPREMRGLKDNVRNVIMDAILANLMQEWYQFS